jgi:hypothetical protein
VTTSNNNFKSGAIKSLASPKDNVGIVDKPKSTSAKAVDWIAEKVKSGIKFIAPTKEELKNPDKLPGAYM